jgi:hypothetical protein
LSAPDYQRPRGWVWLIVDLLHALEDSFPRSVLMPEWLRKPLEAVTTETLSSRAILFVGAAIKAYLIAVPLINMKQRCHFDGTIGKERAEGCSAS